jgi:putative transposase
VAGFETVEFATLTWVDWSIIAGCSPTGNIPPDEAKAHYYSLINEQKLAA